MEEKNTKTSKSENSKMTPVKKDDAKKKVEELKKRKEEAKEKPKQKDQENIYKLDEKEIPTVKSDITWNGITKGVGKKTFKNIGDFFKNIVAAFTGLDSSIQICIIIPIAIILVVVGNKIYSDRERTELECNYNNTSISMKIDQNIKLVFKEGRIYTETRTTTYEIIDPKVKTLGELETEKRDSNEDLKNFKGVKANYEIQDEKLINTIEYNFYKLSNDDITELGLDKDSSLTEYKERYESFGYTCQGEEK